MPLVHKTKDGEIVGVFLGAAQETFASEVSEDDPALVAFFAKKMERIVKIEAQYPITQRAMREAMIILAELDPRLKQTPLYARCVAAESLIDPIRKEP